MPIRNPAHKQTTTTKPVTLVKFEPSIGAIDRAIDQQEIGSHLHNMVQCEIAALPSSDRCYDYQDLVDCIKRLQARRALHYSRARNLLGLHD